MFLGEGGVAADEGEEGGVGEDVAEHYAEEAEAGLVWWEGPLGEDGGEAGEEGEDERVGEACWVGFSVIVRTD